jgi:hypothetical protein
LVVVAVRHIDTGVVAMVQAGVPLMVAVMAHFIFDEERLEARQLVGLTAGMTGIVLIVGPLAAAGRRELLIGVAAMLLTTLLYAYGTVYARSIATKDPTTLACGQQAFGALVATMISIAIEAPALSAQPMQIWVYFAILGVVCSAVPTVLYLGLLARTTSVRSSLVAYLQPVWASPGYRRHLHGQPPPFPLSCLAPACAYRPRNAREPASDRYSASSLPRSAPSPVCRDRRSPGLRMRARDSIDATGAGPGTSGSVGET